MRPMKIRLLSMGITLSILSAAFILVRGFSTPLLGVLIAGMILFIAGLILR